MDILKWVQVSLTAAILLGLTPPVLADGAPLVSAKEIESRLTAIVGDETQPRVELAIEFEFYDAQLTEIAERQVRELGLAMKSERLKDAKFQINGHTDAAGKESYNKILSRERAKAVYYTLIQEMGIDRKRLSIHGYGSERLKNTADPLAAENRRVEVINLSAGEAGKSSTKSSTYKAIQ